MEIKFPEFNQGAVTAIKKLPTRQFVPAGDGGPYWIIPNDLAPQAAKLLAPFFPDLAAEIEEGFAEETEVVDLLIDIQRAGNIEDLSSDEAAALVADTVARLNLPEGESLYSFQEIGVAFAELTKGQVLLGDEMGLGKGVMTLAWLSLHPEYRPVIAFVPGKLRSNWEKETNKWLPGETVQVIRSGKDTVSTEASIIILSYELAAKHKLELLDLKPSVVILDEVTKISNKKATRTRVTLAIARNAPHRIALSGTPVRNRPAEFFNILNLLKPDTFPKFFSFALKYCAAREDEFGWNFSGSSNEEELAEAVRPIMIRRLKNNVLKDLPPKRRLPIVVDLSPEIDRLYKDADAELKEALRAFRTYQRETKTRDLGLEYQQYLSSFVPESPGEEPSSYRTFAWDVAYAELGQDRMIAIAKLNLMRQIVGLGKAELVYDIAEDFLNAGEKLVIYGHHRRVLDTIESSFAKAGVRTVRVDGTSKDSDVAEAVELFQNEPDVTVFIGSTLAAGQGLTLTAASNVLIVERQWTPADEVQAEDRLHRIGQSESVTAWYLVVKDTVDDKMNLIVEGKRKKIGLLLDGDERGGRATSSSILGEVLKEYA